MDQQKIGNLIKQIRKDNNLTQAELADKLGVTYQAVSKWENGKNIPDIEILKELKRLYNINIDNLLDGEYKRNKYILPVVIVIILVFIIIILLVKNDSFLVKHIDTSCDNFNIEGIAAFNNKKTSLYIDDVSYCGEDSNEVYTKIDSGLYSVYDNKKELLEQYTVLNNISLQDYIKKLNLLVLEYSSTCNLFKDKDIYLIINAYNKDKITTYEIPIKLKDNC